MPAAPPAAPVTTRRTFGAAALLALATTALDAAPALAAPVGRVPTAPAVVLSDDALVRAWYGDFLGRTPAQAAADAGRQGWVAALGAGTAPAEVLRGITATREYVERQVASAYVTLLGRAPDAGAAGWVEGVLAGRFPLEWVVQNVLASGELAALHPGGAGGSEFLVDAWYGQVLGRRDATGGEEGFWGGRVAAVGRLGALREMYYSPEAVTHRVQVHHAALLDRAATPAQAADWAPREVRGDLEVQVLLAATPEYRGDRSVA